MCKNIHLGPAGKVKYSAGRQEAETGPGQVHPVFPFEHPGKYIPKLMQVKHVGSGIVNLVLGQFIRSPVRGLLLFGNRYGKQLLA